MKLAKIVKQCRIDKPAHFKLADHDPAERFGLSTDIEDVRPMLADSIAKLAVVRRSFGPQARHLARRFRGHHRGDGQAQARLSQSHRQGIERAKKVRARA
jgi:hypothetical protein